MFGLGSLFYTILFSINAIAVLSEDRFLARIGWSTKSQNNSAGVSYGYGYDSASTPAGDGVKSRLINLISATRTLLRIPLIIVNVLVILYQIVLG